MGFNSGFKGLIMCLEELKNAAWKHVVLRVPNETRTKHLAHRRPRRLTRLFAHCSLSEEKRDFHKLTSKTERKKNKQRNKELSNERKQEANLTIKGCSYNSAALYKHWNETRSHEIKYVASDLFRG